MRILLVSNYFPEHIGGIETVADHLARGYRRLGHRVLWAAAQAATTIHKGHLDDLPLPAWNLTEDRLGFPYPILTPVGIARLLAGVGRSDVVHVHDCLYQASAIATVAASARRKPVVLTQHIGMIQYKRQALRLAQQLAYRTLGRVVLSRTSTVTFISQQVADWFATISRKARSAPVIANGVDTMRFHPVDAGRRRSLRGELGLPHTGPLLLFCGRFVEKKGLHLLEPIARRHQEWTVVMIGPTGDVDPSSWRLPNVRVVPPMAPSRLAPYYQAADLLTIPSTGEGFPLVVQEAMACGTPALVSDELQESMPASLGFTTARTPEAVEATISRALIALETGDLRARVAAYAEQRWDWETTVDRYLALLTGGGSGQQGYSPLAVTGS